MNTSAPKPSASVSSGLAQVVQPLLLLALVTLVPFEQLYARNLLDDMAAAEIRHYALLTLAILSGSYLALHALLRPRPPWLSAVCAAFAFLFFQFGEITELFAMWGAGAKLQTLGYCAVSLVALAAAAALGKYAVFHRFLLAFAALSLALPTYEIASALARQNAPAATSDPVYELAGNPIWSGTAVRKPNIYWIIADSYPGRAVLQDHYDFDNGPFYQDLSKRDFFIAHSSHASYSSTVKSVSSTLEMETVYESGEDSSVVTLMNGVQIPPRSKRDRLSIIAGNNRSVAFFKELGYRYIHYEGLIYQATRCRGFEDVCLSAVPSRYSELESVLLAKTPLEQLGIFDHDKPPTSRRLKKRGQADSGTGIPELAASIAELPTDQPYFLYAHIFSPHGPHTNDALCNRISKRRMRKHKDFLNQLQCVNIQLTELIDQIARDSPDAIIIINSDHGPRLSAPGFQSIFDYTPEQIQEHLSILNAVRLPPTCRTRLEPDLSPINSLRLVFACLGGHEPRFIDDRHFIAVPWPKHRDHGKIREVEIR
jgi:hypothetical protein